MPMRFYVELSMSSVKRQIKRPYKTLIEETARIREMEFALEKLAFVKVDLNVSSELLGGVIFLLGQF
jgi:hypothetical protein